MSLDNLHDLYIEKIKDLYSAENQIIKALPKMIKGATTPELKQALQDHLTQTEGHARRLEKIATSHNASARGKKCSGMEGLLEEGSELLKEKAKMDVLDAGIIGACQGVEHYEIAGYGTARRWAAILGDEQGAALLKQTEDEEGQADKLLTKLAEGYINQLAENGDDEESEGHATATKTRSR